MYYIYFHNWWPGFLTKTDANNIGFFKKLFAYTKLKDYQITNNLEIANVLFESGKSDDKIRNIKNWKYTICFFGEPVFPIYDKHNLVLTCFTKKLHDQYEKCKNDNIDPKSVGFLTYDNGDFTPYQENNVECPIILYYILGNNILPRLQSKRVINNIPSKFCCFIVSNPRCNIRNRMFHILNNYKRVDSCGSYCNNIGRRLTAPWWSEAYLNYIKQYKFIICFENSIFDSSEKLVNAYLSETIPIYWGSDNIKNMFNPESMIFLEDGTENSFRTVIDRVIELDNNDEKYMEFVNRPVFNEKNKEYWKEHYTLEALGKKIDNVLHL